VEETLSGEIGRGAVVLLGVRRGDTEQEARYVMDKIIRLRMFPDAEGKLNLSLGEINGQLLLVSQFTLYGDVTKGRRPAFTEAAGFAEGKAMYDYALAYMLAAGAPVQCGAYGADMRVELCNDGPVTFIIEK
jgi:D-tyrosyl-tRNA(Tyr) deacylase